MLTAKFVLSEHGGTVAGIDLGVERKKRPVGAGAGSAVGVPETVAVQPVPSSTALSTAASARRRWRGAGGISRSGVEEADPR